MSKRTLLNKLKDRFQRFLLQDSAKSNARWSLSDGTQHGLPNHVLKSKSEQAALFKSKILEFNAELIKVDNPNRLSAAIIDFMQTHHLNALMLAHSPTLNAIRSELSATLLCQDDINETNKKVLLTEAYQGIAESGELFQLSSANSPNALELAPHFHLVILHQRNLVATYENAWQQLRKDFPDSLPQRVNLIAGAIINPASHANPEQDDLRDAHTTQRLIVFLIS